MWQICTQDRQIKLAWHPNALAAAFYPTTILRLSSAHSLAVRCGSFARTWPQFLLSTIRATPCPKSLHTACAGSGYVSMWPRTWLKLATIALSFDQFKAMCCGFFWLAFFGCQCLRRIIAFLPAYLLSCFFLQLLCKFFVAFNFRPASEASSTTHRLRRRLPAVLNNTQSLHWPHLTPLCRAAHAPTFRFWLLNEFGIIHSFYFSFTDLIFGGRGRVCVLQSFAAWCMLRFRFGAAGHLFLVFMSTLCPTCQRPHVS